MKNTEKTKVAEEYTVLDEEDNGLIEGVESVPEEGASKSVSDSVKSMMLSSSIADTNCKELGKKNMDMQFEFAKLACEHPEMAENIKGFAANADAADERGTRRFEKFCDTLSIIADKAFFLLFGAGAIYAYQKGWLGLPGGNK